MNCSIIYYIAYKTGYIQRNINKKLSTIKDIKITGAAAAVSNSDLCIRFENTLKTNDLVIIIGGLSSGGDRNVMTVLSDYFTQKSLEVTSNKKILNPDGGKDGYLIQSGSKYIAVFPDEPEQIDKMIGSELMKHIKITPDEAATLPEPVITHTVVFAPDPNDALEQLAKRRSKNILLIVVISLTAAVLLGAAGWILSQYL
ncbi:MAG: hypothetical protein VZR27_08090 [Acutalibacteraceae bacterium]|nr:hypothetical protein [Acutalibacteraceae bacterium]